MTDYREEPTGEAGRFYSVQPERDLVANWEVDLAKRLEEYLLKFCSGEITGIEADDGHSPVNFAEAALLLQGSVQVYSRKVEYLYSLVLHALEFLSQNRQQEQSEGTSIQPQESGSHAVSDEESDLFWYSDDVPVEARNCLDSSTSKDASFDNFQKPPANLVVLEGDCLDATGDGGELESYLLATNDLYRDFILLDPCDSLSVDDFLKSDDDGKGQSGTYRGSSARKSFQSPTRRSGGTTHKSSLGKNQDAHLDHSSMINHGFDAKNCDMGADPPACDNFEDNDRGFQMDDRYSEPRDSDDSDDDECDPWKPLNPHEPGNLKVKPFKKVKTFRRNGINSAMRISVSTLFPPAKLHGTISPELTEIWEKQQRTFERQKESLSPPLYEKLRESLINGGHNSLDPFDNLGDDNEDHGYDSGIADFGPPDVDMPDNMYMDEDIPIHHEKGDAAARSDNDEVLGHVDPDSHASLEDLCRSHLDALLASIAETEKQTELAARVSSWKQKIEHNLEEQDSRPPFDIHDYGERILNKLSHEADNQNVMSFADVVKGQEKHDVARTFSALLQLVNNGDVDLDRSGKHGESVCYTAVNPFHIRLLSHERRQGVTQFRLSKKRVKSPTRKGYNKAEKENSGTEESPIVNSSSEYESVKSSQKNCKFSVKLGKIGGARCTPDGKRRRRSRLVEPVDLHSAR